MKWVSNYRHPENWKFVIEHELAFESVSQKHIDTFYLIVSDKDGNDMYNYFQEELEAAIQQAQRKFGVPLDSWVEAKPS